MLNILNATIGTGGPLVVEHRGKIFVEHCVLISTDHIERMKARIKKIAFNKIEQTSDRSFSIS
jgi:hypothetical protein